MEIVDVQKEINTLSSSRVESVSVPGDYSRQKAILYISDHSDVRGGDVRGAPDTTATKLMYRLFMKIGATGELPSKGDQAASFLNDFWMDLYLSNHLCPEDIPFPIIIREFTTAMVQGAVERKGNNQAAICQAFNDWISRETVRHRLYQIRDSRYPDKAPRQVTEKATQPTVADYSVKELLSRHHAIRPMKGIGMADMMLRELETEFCRRITLTQRK